jgi:hypothetical protein
VLRYSNFLPAKQYLPGFFQGPFLSHHLWWR